MTTTLLPTQSAHPWGGFAPPPPERASHEGFSVSKLAPGPKGDISLVLCGTVRRSDPCPGNVKTLSRWVQMSHSQQSSDSTEKDIFFSSKYFVASSLRCFWIWICAAPSLGRCLHQGGCP